MLIDRHRFVAFWELSKFAGRSELERNLNQSALETLLASVYVGATPAARERFEQRMNAVADRPWGAVQRPGASKGIVLGPMAPPVLLLLLGQRDDDPDAAEDGNRLPDRDSKAGASWRPLYTALDFWDGPTVLQHIGPAGWQLPVPRPRPLDEGALAESPPAQVIVRPAPVPAATAGGPVPPATPVPPVQPDSPPVASPPLPRPAGTPSPPDANTWKTRGLWAAGGLATATVGAIAVRALLRRNTAEVMP